jgi:hypothetical protein
MIAKMPLSHDLAPLLTADSHPGIAQSVALNGLVSVLFADFSQRVARVPASTLNTRG